MSPPSLLTLRVTLSFWEDDPQVELALMLGAESIDQGGRRWRISAFSLNVPESIDSQTAPTFDLPLQLLEGLRASLAGQPKAMPLWLRFAKPHGHLGVLPWERVLAEALDRPVLRLPDLLERPHENRDVLEVAICFDAAPETPQQEAVEQITRSADAVMRAPPRSHTRISLFTTARWFESLCTSKLDRRLQRHDPATAPTSGEAFKRARERKSFESAWSIWISETLATRSLDAIHFICPSDVTDDGPALVTASSPSPRESVPSLSYISPLQIAAFMTRTGAWSALFTSPPGGTSGATMALFADALAQTRPASVLYQPLLTPEHATALRLCYAFLFSPRPAEAPVLREGFLYCQPAFVTALANLEVPSVLAATQLNAALIEAAAPPGIEDFEQPPKWVNAVQRHLEGLELEQLRRSSPDVLLSTPECARTQIDLSARSVTNETEDETLADIQKVVGSYLQKLRS